MVFTKGKHCTPTLNNENNSNNNDDNNNNNNNNNNKNNGKNYQEEEWHLIFTLAFQIKEFPVKKPTQSLLNEIIPTLINMLTLLIYYKLQTVLQKIHLKTDFISTAIPSSTKIRQILENDLSTSGKWNGKSSKNQSCIGQLLIMPNYIRTGIKGSTYVWQKSTVFWYHWSITLTKGPSSFRNVARKTSFTSLIIKKSHRIISKT